MHKKYIILYLLFCLNGLKGQDKHPWCSRPENTYGKYISRTLAKLEKSTYNSPEEINIIVYGQSFSKQIWWTVLKDSLSARYPSAKLNMVNKSIRDFSSQKLWKTLDFDITPFYPDLVIFNASGSHSAYEKILKTIRSRTSAEMLVWNTPYTKENSWSDTISYHIIPGLCEKYKLEFVNVRALCEEYPESTNPDPSLLLKKEGAQLNEKANYLLSGIMLKHFKFNPSFREDPYTLTDTLNLQFREGVNRMDLEFRGTAVEVIINDSIPVNQKFRVLVDGLPPAKFQGSYFNTRPNEDLEKDWPWETGAVYHLENHAKLENEDWTVEITHCDDSLKWFSFVLHSSVSGFEGTGTSRMTFVSNSGKVVIEPDDWFIREAMEHSGLIVKPGFRISWKSYTRANDFIYPDMSGQKVWMIQGLHNKNHLLQIISFGDYPLPIKKLIIHRPFLTESE